MTESQAWRNRIIGYADVPPALLMENELNWRVHPEEQVGAVEAVLSEIGYVQNVIVNLTTSTYELVEEDEEDDAVINFVRTNEETPIVERIRLVTPHLVDGHLRRNIAIEHRQATIPVTFVDLTEEEELKALATFDPLAAMAKVEASRLRTLLDGRFHVDSEPLQTMLAEWADQAGIYNNPDFTPLSSDASYAHNPYEDKQYLTRKQVTILFDMAEYALFNAAVKALGAHYNFDAMTQIVLQTMTDAAETIPEPHVLPRREKPKKAELAQPKAVRKISKSDNLPTLTVPPARDARPAADQILPVDESTAIPELI